MSRCKGIVPGTFTVCGEYQQCSDECWALEQAAALGRVTPEKITDLRPLDVFVYGANEAGILGAGAALTARRFVGRRSGVCGPSGRTFAIPTKPRDLRLSLPLDDVSKDVAMFVTYVSKRRDRCFLVTEIGCGLAGYQPAQIAPMFRGCAALPHVCLPQRFWAVLQ